MIDAKKVEEIARRYGIIVSYENAGNGGFIVDETQKVYRTIAEDIEMIFWGDIMKSKARNVSYWVDETNLLAA